MGIPLSLSAPLAGLTNWWFSAEGSGLIRGLAPGKRQLEQGGLGGVGAEGGLEALSAPFPKLPGMLKGELHSQPFSSLEGNGEYFSVQHPKPPAPRLVWPAQPKMWPRRGGGGRRAGGRDR